MEGENDIQRCPEKRDCNPQAWQGTGAATALGGGGELPVSVFQHLWSSGWESLVAAMRGAGVEQPYSEPGFLKVLCFKPVSRQGGSEGAWLCHRALWMKSVPLEFVSMGLCYGSNYTTHLVQQPPRQKINRNLNDKLVMPLSHLGASIQTVSRERQPGYIGFCRVSLQKTNSQPKIKTPLRMSSRKDSQYVKTSRTSGDMHI